MSFTDYISVWVVLFLLFFNGGAELLVQTGAADYLDINTELGEAGDQLESARDSAKTYETGTGSGSTLFGTYNRVGDVLNNVFNTIMPGARLIKNAGAPSDLVNFFFAGLALIPPIELGFFLRSG